MYRQSDVKLFMLISAMSFIFLLGAFALVSIYHFLNPMTLYRNLAACFIIVSFALQVQLYTLKIEIMEKKVIKVVQTPPDVYAAISSAGTMAHTVYTIFFWFTMMIVGAAFVLPLFYVAVNA